MAIDQTPTSPDAPPSEVASATAAPGQFAAGGAEASAETAAVISFWQRPFCQNILPFLTSLILHLGLITIGLLTYKVVEAVVNPRVEQVIIPEAQMVTNGPEGGIPHPGLGGDPTRDTKQDQIPDVPRDTLGLASKASPTLQSSLMGGGSGDLEAASATIAIGPSTFGKGTGTGTGSGYGAGDNAGLLAPFGVPGGGGGLGPRANFIGLGGNARRIAYVCDASGSMLNMFDALRIELRNSIEGLKLIQSFNVLFFQDQGFKAADAGSLMMANPDNKRKSYDFLDKSFPRGETNPIPALEAAFRQQSELIYLLTDGDFSGPGNQAVVEFCKKRTADGKVKINTIAFIAKENRENPQDLEYVKALRAIAENSGGRFRHVSDEDLGQ